MFARVERRPAVQGGKNHRLFRFQGIEAERGYRGKEEGKGGDSRNASRGAPPLARCCAPCSVCISTVGMIVGAEAGHCPAWIFLSIERETDGREEEKKAGTERGSGSEDDPRPLPDPQTPAVTGAFVRGWRGPLPPPWQQRKKKWLPPPFPLEPTQM